MIAPMIAPIGRVACSVINLSLSHDRSHDRSAVIEADQSKMDQVHGGRGDYIRGTGVLSLVCGGFWHGAVGLMVQGLQVYKFGVR